MTALTGAASRACLLVAVLLLSGCAASTPPTDSPTSLPSSSTSSSGQPRPPVVVENQTYAREVHWDDCQGWESGWKYGPAAPPGSHHNPKWSDPEVGLFVTVVTEAMDCQRVSWGPFERPVRMIWETHDWQEIPESCFSGPNEPNADVTVGRALASFWVNDTQLADYLQQTYPGLPVYYSA
ncbi:MAG: hypothetical protein LC623_09735, partial [Halobacteriales archaeon]|nr:hypothetical protein [Halobacteriales archaeon]